MSRSNNNRNLSLFIGLWIGLTLVAGVAVFFLLMWASNSNPTVVLAPTLTTAPPTQAVSLIPTVTAASQPATAAPDQVVPPPCDYPPEKASGFGYGIQAHSLIPGISPLPGIEAAQVKLGLQWMKLQVRWAIIEPQQGQYDWGVVDNAVDAACSKGMRIMLSVVAAPVWTRANPLPAPEGQEAPPDDFNVYANFIAQLLDRYPGRIQAVEVWNEANLEREWNTAEGVNPVAFAQMMQAVYPVIKGRNPNILVISGAPAPTGINCRSTFPNCAPEGRIIVMDDATYLTQFIAAGGLSATDCVGIHSNGSNLPPATDAYNPGLDANYTFKGPWSNPHYSWSLRSQVEAYIKLLPADKPLCMTEFGYASPQEGKYPPNFAFAADVTEQQQAEYIVQAYQWMRESGRVKMAFLFNLDYAPLGGDPAEDDNSIFGILTRGGIPRPAFDAIGGMEKP